MFVYGVAFFLHRSNVQLAESYNVSSPGFANVWDESTTGTHRRVYEFVRCAREYRKQVGRRTGARLGCISE